MRIEAEDRGIVDRSREHLVATDLAITAARRRLLRMIKTLQAGEPLRELASGEIYGVRTVCKLCEVAELDDFIEKHRDDARAGCNAAHAKEEGNMT